MTGGFACLKAPRHAAAQPSGPRVARACEHGRLARAQALTARTAWHPRPSQANPLPFQFDQSMGAPTEALKESKSKECMIDPE
jgi:hypothetical protein